MSRTINRMPNQVKTPTSKEARNYFHNQYEWLGVNDDRNFVEVDQKYFQDANNLYVDTEGVLRSRPSLKIRTIIYNSVTDGETTSETLRDIDNVWRFVGLTVYLSLSSDGTVGTLYFAEDGNDTYIQQTLQTEHPEEVYLYKIKSRLYIFTSAEIKYYENGVVYDGIPTLYIPITKQITNNSVEASPESPNELTKSYKIKYIYDNRDNIDFNTFLGQTVDITINNETIPVTFQRNTQFVIVQKYSIADGNNLSDTKILGQNGENTPLVEVRKIDYSYTTSNGEKVVYNKVIMRCSYNYTLDASGIPSIHWNIYYSYDGISYNVLPELNKTILGKPYLNDNGDMIVVICPDGPYAYKFRGLDTIIPLYDWKNLFNYVTNAPTWLSTINLNNLPNQSILTFKQSTVVSGHFVDEQNYAITYGDNPTTNNSYVEYSTMYVVLCCAGKLHKTILFDCSPGSNVNTREETFTYDSTISTASVVKQDYANTSGSQSTFTLFDGSIVQLVNNEQVFDSTEYSVRALYDGTTVEQEYGCQLISNDKYIIVSKLNVYIQCVNDYLTVYGSAEITYPSESAAIHRYTDEQGQIVYTETAYTNVPMITNTIQFSQIIIPSDNWLDEFFDVQLFQVSHKSNTLTSKHTINCRLYVTKYTDGFGNRYDVHLSKHNSDNSKKTFYTEFRIEPANTLNNTYYLPSSFVYNGPLANNYASLCTNSLPNIYIKTVINNDKTRMLGVLTYETNCYKTGILGTTLESFTENNTIFINFLDDESPFSYAESSEAASDYICYTNEYDYLYTATDNFPSVFSTFLTAAKSTNNYLKPVHYNYNISVTDNCLYVSGIQYYTNDTVEYTCNVICKVLLSDINQLISEQKSFNEIYYLDYDISTKYTENILSEQVPLYSKVAEDGLALFYNCIVDYNNLLFDEYQDLIIQAIPIYISRNYLFNYYNGAIYSNEWQYPVEIIRTEVGEINYKVFEHITELSSYYFSSGKNLYISQAEYDEDDNLLLYLPKINTQKFANDITNLHPISDKEIAVFFENEIILCQFDASYGITGAYRYTKSKIQVGCLKGCDVITTFDGKYIIFNSNRGLAVMSYQEFVASTEQAVTYISDKIYSWYKTYTHLANSVNEIKLFRHGYWIIIYKKDAANGFVFDVRNNSWWPVSIQTSPSGFIEVNDYVQVLTNGRMFDLNTSDNEYYDTYNDDKVYKIPWHLLSQKLHFDAINYVKHIVNITLNSTYSGDTQLSSNENIGNFTFRLQANCYRKRLNGNVDKPNFTIVDYVINIVRTYVQRLNYFKVNEFQYKLSNDEAASFTVPLSLASITVKYKIGTEVR